MDTPVLLIAWRRPHTLRQVIDAIRPLAPSRLYVACDGPIPEQPGEAEKVAATRLVIEQEIDWPCQIEKLYSDVNQGCRLGVSRAITWFFEHVEEGIILEDDCVPHPDFFLYCTNLLKHYRKDTRIWCISGNNFEDIPQPSCGDYFFSSIPMIWGWATWRDRWSSYDVEMAKWPTFKERKMLNSVFPDSLMRKYWASVWDSMFFRGFPDTWDYQWVFTCVSNGGLTVIPAQNLIHNVGFGTDATHTLQEKFTKKALGLESKNQLNGPGFICNDFLLDKLIFDLHFGGRWRRYPLVMIVFPIRLARKLGALLKLIT